MRRMLAAMVIVLTLVMLAPPLWAICAWSYPPNAAPVCGQSCEVQFRCNAYCDQCIPTSSVFITRKWGCGCGNPCSGGIGGPVTMSVSLYSGVAPYGGWEAGTVYTVSLSESPTFGVANDSEEWGTATDDDLELDTLSVRVTLATGPTSNTRILNFSSLDAQVVSFEHSKITPEETGLNEIKLADQQYFPSVGIVDVTTGLVSGTLFLRLYNDYYDNDTKAGIEIPFEGRFRSSTGTAIDEAFAEFGEVD